MEYCIRSMGIPELSAFLMQIGQNLRMIEDSPEDIMSFFKKIQTHGRVRSKLLSRGLVRSQSIEL